MNNTKELTFRLTTGDFDQYDSLSPYAISDLFQEAATIHAEELNVGYEIMKNKNLAWIIARNKITFINHFNHTKVVYVKTWPHPNGRFDFDRDYILYNENKDIIAKGTSKWLVYDLNRKFLTSSKGIMEDIDFSNEKNYEEKFDKINYGDLKEYKLVSQYKIEYTDLDHYGHMNNAKYFNLMSNVLNLKENEFINEVQIDYLNQGYYNKIIDIYLKKEGQIYYLVGKAEELIIFAIKVEIRA